MNEAGTNSATMPSGFLDERHCHRHDAMFFENPILAPLTRKYGVF
jgi:hypothetical protein